MLSLQKKVEKFKIVKSFNRFIHKNKEIKDINYQYIQRSKVPTMHFQKSLPQLPIPDLHKTGERYLNALKPLLTTQQYKEAEIRTVEFTTKEGIILQEKLILKNKANRHTSFTSNMSLNAYLSERKPLPINFNTYVAIKNDQRPEYNDQLIRATNLLTSTARFVLSLREELLEPTIFPSKRNTRMFSAVTRILPESAACYGARLFKAYPQDMSQFYSMFGATRIPQLQKDKLLREPNSKHFLVQRRGHLYAFDVLDSDAYLSRERGTSYNYDRTSRTGNLLTPNEILGNLKRIVDDTRPAPECPIGILTCQNRDDWAKQRAYLEETGNQEVLKTIDTAIINLVLDDETILHDYNKLTRLFLHGDGINRWFDKSSLIISKDGVSAVNYDHSWGDGVTVLRYLQDIYNETTTLPFVHPESEPATTNINVNSLEFKFCEPEKIKFYINKATKEYKDACDSLDVDHIVYKNLKYKNCKKYNVSPDAMMQLGFQAAHHLLNGTYVGTYEPCNMSGFKHARLDTIIPCTEKTKAFCDGLHLKTKSKKELYSLIFQCSMLHRKLIHETSMGQGFEAHMSALRKLAEENLTSVPELYESFEYKYLNNYILSTSTLGSPVMFGGFGPVSPNGFGIAYTMSENIAVTSYKCNNSSTQFVEALHDSFENITRLLDINKDGN